MSARLGPKRRIALAIKAVNLEISHHAARGGEFAGPLSGEGYSGGYADALNDVTLLLNGCVPNRRQYWVAETAEGAEK